MDISLIIPIYNQISSLKCVLESIKFMNYSSGQYEIIIVDDGSHDPIKSAVKKYQNAMNIKYIRHEKNKGRAAARNAGAATALGDVLIFSDGDRVLSPDFFRQHFEGIDNNSVCMGKTLEIYSQIPDADDSIEELAYDIVYEKEDIIKYTFNYAYQELVFNIYDRHGVNNSNVPWISFLSGNFSIGRSAFCQLGGFDENFITWGLENIEFGYRAYKSQLKFLYNQNAINYHLFHKTNRNPQFLSDGIQYFYNKHQDYKILKYYKFILGEVPLSELDNMLGNKFYIRSKIGSKYRKG